MIASISSTTSKYASLLVYFTADLRHGTLDNWPAGNVSQTLQQTNIIGTYALSTALNIMYIRNWLKMYYAGTYYLN